MLSNKDIAGARNGEGKQISKSTLSRSLMREIVVKELAPSLRDDFLLFFDSVAFADNPDWSDCYCSAYHFTNNKGKAESRREALSLVDEDRMHGFLAYESGKPVGWCNAAPRSSYPGVQWLMSPGPDKYERVGSIVCFVIASTSQPGSRIPSTERCMQE